MSVLMVDGIGQDASSILERFGPRQPVATYVNGPVSVWTPAEESWFASKIRIGVMPGQPEQARVARVLDVERYDAAPADAPGFIAARLGAGHRDATIYCSAETVGGVLSAGTDSVLAALTAGNARLWVAWYWGAGEPGSPDPLVAELARLGTVVDPGWVWAWQFAGRARWDVSAVFGVPDWSR